MKRLLRDLVFLLFTVPLFAAELTLLPPPEIDNEQQQKFLQWQLQFNKTQLNYDVVVDGKTYLNELVYSRSPYLIQHVQNPVNWKPWSSELLSQAKKENKLIFLSIGYSTCHWCHVMEKESFTNLEVAKLLNKNFYSIKVDREELPHIDDYYAAALEHVKGSAGWPITAIITGDGVPVFIDSYISKEKLIKLLSRVNKIWQQQPEFLLTGARHINSLVNQQFSIDEDIVATLDSLDTINRKLLAALDPINGGFQGTVKFPSEAMLLYAFDQLRRDSNSKLEKAVKLQLDNMVSGGLLDHVQGGFHRYSTDPTWTVPHFEKMLYSQAQLILVFSQAFDYFHDPVYKAIVARTVDFMLSSFYAENRGFRAAIDADFDGEEGGYYLWSDKQLNSLNLKPDFYKTYQVPGSLKKGIIFPFVLDVDGLKPVDEQKPVDEPKPVGELSPIETSREKLASIRQSKGNPHLDNKVLTGWNALAIKALVKAGKLLNKPEFLTLAGQLAEKLWIERYQPSTGLLNRTGYAQNQPKPKNIMQASLNQDSIKQSYLEDYAYFCDALISLYDQTGEKQWLNNAELLGQQAINHFMDKDGGFYNSSLRTGKLSLKKTQDSELVSASAVMLNVMSKLDERRGIKLLKKRYSNALTYMLSRIVKEPLNHLYSALSLNTFYEGSTLKERFFASAKGKMVLDCQKSEARHCNELAIRIDLEKGWHINSNKPLQSYLEATRLEVPSGFKVIYPKEKIVKLGFQEQPLSVYEGDFKIIIKRQDKSTTKSYLSIPLQACSDSVCLLPEIIDFYM